MTVTSMAATSKIPLPKSAVSSPSGGGSSPAVSKIPVKKDFRSPGYSNLNKENCDGKRLDASPLVRPDYGLNGKGIESRVVDGKELDYKGLNGGKQSRIPDIRSKRSPQKEVISSRSRTDLYRDVSDMSTDDQRSSRSTRSRSISTSSEPRSGDTSDQTDGCVLRPPEPRRNDGREARPSQLTLTGKAKTSKSVAGSRIPLSPSMLDRDLRSVSGSRKASIESLTNLSPDWETQMSYEELAEPLEIDCSRTSKSRSDSPGKRGRPSSPAVCKMRRTSPDGESVSPSKTRKPSPSKIPISAEYIKYSSGSSSQSPEDYLTPQRSSRRGSESGLLSPAYYSEYETAGEQDADDDVGGGGEGLGELGVDLGDGHHVGPVHDLLFRQGLHLDLVDSSPRSPSHRSNLPHPNWSIAKEATPRKPTHSVSSSELPAPSLPSPPTTPPERKFHSTSRLPAINTKDTKDIRDTRDTRDTGDPRDTSSISSDSDLEWERGKEGRRGRDEGRGVNGIEMRRRSEGGEGGRKKSFEAFVMTGDRMINLARTPANTDFRSKYYKPNTTNIPEDENNPANGLATTTSQEQEQDQDQAKQRSNQNSRRSLVRNSKSEDQLTVPSDSIEDEDEYLGQSCHTLHSECSTAPPPPSLGAPGPGDGTSSSEYSSKSKPSSTDQLISQLSEGFSPELSTSSLITCSEHYNGNSLLDNFSPQSPNSPETPEWSLIANGDSFHKDIKRGRGDSLDTSSISNQDNRVIITIGQNEVATGLSSPGTSSGTMTPPQPSHTPRTQEARSPVEQSPPPLQPPSPLSSEEESDLDSLHSYHPPVRTVDIPSAYRLAKRLYNLEGFRKGDVSRHLSKNNDFSKAVADEYCKSFEFAGLSLDEALRTFLSRFSLIGETQERERVLLHFSKRYLESNFNLRGHSFQSHDAVHTLTCAIMLLNTDLHNTNLQLRKMSPKEFVENLADLNDGHNFPPDLLFNIYTSIKREPIQWVQEEDEDEEDIYEPEPERPESSDRSRPLDRPRPSPVLLANSVNLGGQQVGGVNPFLNLPDEDSVDYKRGFVIRKCCVDANGKKTKLGKRGWKMFYLTLRDLVLFCFKDEQSAGSYGAFDNPNIAIRIHHAIAYRATDYRKKRNVLRLLTSDRAEFLFQASDEQELFAWLETINTVVARFSSPPLPAPVSSSAKFQRPLFPSSCSRLSLADQLTSHRQQLDQLEQQLILSSSNPPSGGKKFQDNEKLEFLQSEKDRFQVYIRCLETLKSKHESQLLSSPMRLMAQ